MWSKIGIFSRLSLVALGLILANPSAARAEFVVCNRSFDVVNLAIGLGIGQGFQTEGWWTIGTNQCATVLKERLSNRYIYIYARDVFGRAVLDGDIQMCVDQKKFVILGIDSCWVRGLTGADFVEIDTGDSDRWTVFLEGSGG